METERLVVQEAGAQVGMRRDVVVVQVRGREVGRARLQGLRRVELLGDVELTATARRKLLQQDVDVVLFTRRGRYVGRLVSAENQHGERRLAQLSLCLDPERRLAGARAIVAAKLRGQAALLQRFQRRGKDLRAEVAALVANCRRLDAVDTLDAVRGVEGLGARLYFQGLGKALTHPTVRFTGRNRRPPRDPVNACLSFAYTMLLSEIESVVRASGLDPGCGLLHEAGRGNPVLAFDLMEPFRVVVDRMVWGLFNRGQLTELDFVEPPADPDAVGDPELARAEPEEAQGIDGDEDVPPGVEDEGGGEGDGGGARGRAVVPCYAGPTARRALVAGMAAAWETRHSFLVPDASHALRDVARMQAEAMCRHVEGRDDVLKVFTFRG